MLALCKCSGTNIMGNIKVTNLGKAYKVYPHKWSRLFEWMWPTMQKKHTLKWILQDVSFNVDAGDAVGILGVNGAGKSTLLKMITGTTQPTTGEISVNGRVAALLELGMGFHPDFTGRQNVMMAGQLQGLSQEQIVSALPEIEKFADIGEYINSPVRVYSSGMQMRLAFAVATAYRPDILIVDEALSVGDAAFQKKCFSRIEAFQEQGTTLLIVSHSTDTINRICSKAILLNQGQLVAFGNAKDITQAYEKLLYGSNNATLSNEAIIDSSLVNPNIETQYGNRKAQIKDFHILDYQHRPANVIKTNEPFFITYNVVFHEDIQDVSFGTMIKTVDDICIYGKSTYNKNTKKNYNSGDVVSVEFELKNHLANGIYYLNCGCQSANSEGEREYLHRRVDVAIFKVNLENPNSMFVGLVNLNANTTIKSDRH
jgi:lipopolysaccharide transport system ATP-binding protein